MATPALAFRGLHLSFPDGEGGQAPVLRDLDLEVAEGEFLAVVGPSGCGKSTLLNLACGILTPDAGQVVIRGNQVNSLVHEDLGYVFQSDALLPWKRVFDNVALALRMHRVPEAEVRRRTEDWLHRVGLAGFGHHFPGQLSGGMRKRAAIAGTLVHDPSLVLMDEPFSMLDVQTRNLLQAELLRLWEEERRTVLFVTHDLEEALALADRVVVLTARPATVRALYPVDLPRPRDLVDLRLSPRFHELVGRLWSDLREEVDRALAAAPGPL
jgi:NitT/TauT family transport system ATP-binding protein